MGHFLKNNALNELDLKQCDQIIWLIITLKNCQSEFSIERNGQKLLRFYQGE